jgi:hypothetical protein
MRAAVTTAALTVLGALTAVAAEAGPRELSRDGVSHYVILVPADAAPAEATAARELRTCLREVTGADLPILPETEAPKDKPFVAVGPCRLLGTLLPTLDLAKVGFDGIVIKTVGANLVLAGPRPRGTLYAVYTFLEDVVGCRWWTSTEQTLPTRPTLAIPDLDVVYAPPLRSREAFYRDAFAGPFAAKLKINGHFERIPPEYGGHLSILGWCHTFFQILPPETYFAAHPEWYSEINGTRSAEGTQLCLTNAAMRAEFVRVAKERIRQDPNAGLISVSQNDWGGRCQCAACRDLEQQEGSPSGPLLHFVNAVAAEIETEFPEVLVETLAYSYTRQPPKFVRPRANVVIRLCSIECSYVQPLETGEQNATFRHDIETWSASAPRLYVWDYVTNFANYLLPHPNLRVLAPNLRFFIKNHAIGLFEQGDAGSGTGDFVRLRAWLLAHLMWDPSRDENALIDEFLRGYYGAAGPLLRQYLDLLHDQAEAAGVYLRCYMQDTGSWLTPEALERATAVYAQATAAVAGDPVLSERVRRERLPLDLVWLQRYTLAASDAAAAGTPVVIPGAASPQQAVEEFIALSSRHEVGQYAEGRPFAPYAERLQQRIRAPGPPPEACRALPRAAWADYQDSTFTLHGQGTWSDAVRDAAASDGYAARMPGDHHEWAVQQPLSDALVPGNPWRLFVVLRCEATVNNGIACTIGIYDERNHAGLASRDVQVAEVVGTQYRAIELGPVSVHGGAYVWVAPPRRPGEVTAVYVDRLYLVREPTPAQ